MNHYLSKKGYVFLIFFLYAGMTAIFNIVSGNLYRFGAELPFWAYLGCKIAILFAVSFMVAGRFLDIEKRLPTNDERSSIAFWSFLLVTLGMVLYVPLALGLSKMRPELNSNDFLSGLVIMLTILSALHFVFSHLNFGFIAKTRTINTA